MPTSAPPTDLNTPWSLDSALSKLPHPPSSSPPTSPLPFLHFLERLKTTKREGWRRFGIINGESIADHMYRMSIITMLCPPSLARRLDIPRCTKMALVHDMAESLVGDITPIDNIPKVEKNRQEASTMDFLTGRLLGKSSGAEEAGRGIREVWQEYEDGQTLEAKFVHDVDKMELMLQMLEYERAHDGKIELGEFAWVKNRVQLEEVKAWCEELMRERQEYWSSIGKPELGRRMKETPREANGI